MKIKLYFIDGRVMSFNDVIGFDKGVNGYLLLITMVKGDHLESESFYMNEIAKVTWESKAGLKELRMRRKN